MRKIVFSALIFLIFCGFAAVQQNPFPPVKNESFARGEVLNYKMVYGFFTVGRGLAKVHPQYYSVNDRNCFKVEIFGKTVGMVDWVADVDDQWGSYIDTISLLPHQFYRRIRENHYKKDEWTNFDQVNNRIEVKTLDKKTGKLKEPKYYDAPAQVRDMLSGYLFLRTLDFSKIKVNDTISVPGFFEDSFYTMKILYKGKEVIKTKVGRVKTFLLVPVMPNNKIFDGENSVSAWFSDDKNRIPVKISADLFIGSASVELTSYEGLKSPLNIVKK